MLKQIANLLVKLAVVFYVTSAKHNDRKAKLKIGVVTRTEKLINGAEDKLAEQIKLLQARKNKLTQKLITEKIETLAQATHHAEEAADLISKAQRLRKEFN